MKLAKKVIALTLVALLALSLIGCHQKGEIAVKVGDTEFTSAFYMCCLIAADNEARTTVQENLTAAGEDTTSIDYTAQTLDDKDYTTWVKDKALEMCKNYGAAVNKCNELGLTLDQEDIDYNSQYCDYYWNNYGYEAIYSQNGVGYETFKYFNLMGAYENLYFEYIYGTDMNSGTKPLTAEDMKSALTTNFAGVYAIYSDISEMDETAVAEVTEKFNGYKTKLDKKTSFSKIYTDFYGDDVDEPTDGTPDKYMQVIGDENTSYNNEIWTDVTEMALNESKVITTDSAIYLVVKKDLTAYDYYNTYLYSAAAYVLKQSEFNETLQAEAEEYTVTTVAKAINQFKVDKINYSTNS